MHHKTLQARPDRRTARTRRQLRESLVTLILERGWDRVSVQEICAHANVGRSTFYVHFADKEELLLSGLDELHVVLDGVRVAEAGSFAFAEALVTHVKDARRLFRAVVGRKSGQPVMRKFRDVVLRLVASDLEHLGFDGEERESLARYISGGFVELLTAWIDRPASADPTVVSRRFRALTVGVLASAGAPCAPRARRSRG